MDFFFFHAILLFSGFVHLDATALRLKRDDDDHCNEVAQALKTWLEAWSVQVDYQPEWRTSVFDHLSNVLLVDFKNIDDLRSLSCKLIAAKNLNEIQEVLQVSTEVMSIIQGWAQSYSEDFGAGDLAVQFIPLMRAIDDELRKLGYPSVPLTASRADVEKFLLDLYSETKPYPLFHDLIALDSAALADVLTGLQTIDDAAQQYNIDKDKLSDAYSLLTFIGETENQGGWDLNDSNLRGYDALTKAGIIDKLLIN